jgi:wyosine [tRNA(Phe)-imidazoG37] synthetase (radical SAM superfamily)
MSDRSQQIQTAMMRETTVFGPIFSRRLGSSLGINLLPQEGKLCNFDCIYCECGWNRDGKGDRAIPTAEDVRKALTAKLEACHAAGTPIDSITFSGDGEPTLNPEFPEIIDLTLALRDRYYPEAKVSVLSNATKTWREGVFQALRRVDNPILKLDAATDAQAKLVNQPVGAYHVEDIVRDLERFEGNFVLQTMFLKGDGFATEDWVGDWMDIVRRLRPREVMVYTIDRETPQQGLRKYTVEEMRALVQPLLDEGFKIQIKG